MTARQAAINLAALLYITTGSLLFFLVCYRLESAYANDRATRHPNIQLGMPAIIAVRG